MPGFPALLTAVSTVIGLLVGFRLLRVWLRTRQVAELIMGIVVTSAYLAGLLLLLVTRGMDDSGPLAIAVWALAIALVATNPAALFIGMWRIFRPQEPWARGLAAVGVLGMVVWAVLRVWEADLSIYTSDSRLALLFHSLGPVAKVWLLVESVRYYRMSQRRVALGIGKAMTSHRFLLWALSAVFYVIRHSFIFYNQHFMAVELVDWPLGLSALSASGLLSVVCLWLAFFPPAAYRARIEASAGARAA